MSKEQVGQKWVQFLFYDVYLLRGWPEVWSLRLSDPSQPAQSHIQRTQVRWASRNDVISYLLMLECNCKAAVLPLTTGLTPRLAESGKASKCRATRVSGACSSSDALSYLRIWFSR